LQRYTLEKEKPDSKAPKIHRGHNSWALAWQEFHPGHRDN
jgi:hypothetical protein